MYVWVPESTIVRNPDLLNFRRDEQHRCGICRKWIAWLVLEFNWILKRALFSLSLQRPNSIIVCVLVKVSKNIFWNHGAAYNAEHPRILKLFNWCSLELYLGPSVFNCSCKEQRAWSTKIAIQHQQRKKSTGWTIQCDKHRLENIIKHDESGKEAGRPPEKRFTNDDDELNRDGGLGYGRV